MDLLLLEYTLKVINTVSKKKKKYKIPAQKKHFLPCKWSLQIYLYAL